MVLPSDVKPSFKGETYILRSDEALASVYSNPAAANIAPVEGTPNIARAYWVYRPRNSISLSESRR